MTSKKQTVEKWIRALRSGNYKQGKNALCRDTEQGRQYCCLGVLCEIENGSDNWEDIGCKDKALWDRYSHSTTLYMGHDAWLNEYIMATHLSEMNDEWASFEEIADYLEKELLVWLSE